MNLVRFLVLIPLFLLWTACSTPPKVSGTHPGTKPAPSSPQRPTLVTPTRPGAPAPITTEEKKVSDLEKNGEYLEALQKYVNLSIGASTPQEQEHFRLKAIELTESRLNEDQLFKVADDSNYGFVRGYALFRLGELSLQRRDPSDAKRYFNSVVQFLPESELAAKAQEFISQIESVRHVDSKTVGVILPLSGKNAVVSQKVLRALQMGLGIHQNNSSLKLAVMDSEGNPDLARQGVERLVKEDKVIAIIGSLLSKTASAVSSKADELGVPTITLSQKSGITEIGPSVFRNALTSEMQIQQLVDTAFTDLGLRRFAILYPNDPYGVEFANIFWDEVLAHGGSIASVQSYNPKENDFHTHIQRLVGTYYIEGRSEEFKFRQRLQKASDTKRSVRKENSFEDLLPPITDFDAIFIPDNAKTMGQIAAFLSYANVKNIRLLGTNLWNVPGIGKRAGNFSNQLVFVDGLFLKNQIKSSDFFSEYQKIFNESPGLLELQAYDTALILRQLLLQGTSSREELIRRLTDLKNFPGALGTLSMTSEREIQRPVVVLTLDKDGQITPLLNHQ